MEVVAVSALVIAVIGALGAFVKTAHLKKCKGCFVESDCTDNKRKTPPESPIVIQPKRDLINEKEISEV
jgi:hypothetical protein